jgi:hypothetical protein
MKMTEDSESLKKAAEVLEGIEQGSAFTAEADRRMAKALQDHAHATEQAAKRANALRLRLAGGQVTPSEVALFAINELFETKTRDGQLAATLQKIRDEGCKSALLNAMETMGGNPGAGEGPKR